MNWLNKHVINVKYYKKCYSTNLQQSASKTRNETSLAIRQKFLDFFINENKHYFIRSSPVVPFCDPTVPFVNAGMNQFKGIFLGTQSAQHRRVANSQKCVRVGGKHNDLSVVGSDGYHHTFFEMLGNWSFGDYFKKEACEMSWKLLTDVYGIDSSYLYVTYFKGDSKLGLQADYECKEIWKSIGVPESRILPFGAKDNFWEMGLTGPCGPCTEIHIDRTNSKNRAIDVNRGLEDLTELWNIVFIQYNRLEDGSIDALPNCHIDTGMGFERLTAVLQNKMSNYDTDIFQPLFSAIHKMCKGVPIYSGKFGKYDVNNWDTNYRILADHSRMITACLADGMIPEENQKLRRIIRRALTICDTNFKSKGILHELSSRVADMFKDCYPEMGKNLHQVQQIIKYEQEVLDSLQCKSINEWEKLVEHEPKLRQLEVITMPGLIEAYKEIKSLSRINGRMAFQLYDRHGLDEQIIQELANALHISFDSSDFKAEMNDAKMKSKESTRFLNSFNTVRNYLISHNVKTTNDSFKYDYQYLNNTYNFKDLNVNVILIVSNDEIVNRVSPQVKCSLLLNQTNMYSEAGGQISDKGSIKFSNGTFAIERILNVDGYIFHEGTFTSENDEGLLSDSNGSLTIDNTVRLNNMMNHTATHLLNSAIKKVSMSTTCQKSSQVTPASLTFDVSIFGNKLTMLDLEVIENLVKSCIDVPTEVATKVMDSQNLLQLENVTLVPGEIYPDTGIRIVEILSDSLFSREACCGTHVLNTNHIKDFSIILTRSLGRSIISIEAVTGERATIAKQNGKQMLETVNVLKKNIDDNIDKPEILDSMAKNLKQQLQYSIDDSNIMPIYIKQQCLDILSVISKRIKESARQTLKGFIEMEMKNALQHNIKTTKTKQNYIVHYLRSSTILDSVSLQKVTNLCPNIPILVISYTDGVVKARCCVPKESVTSTFNAEIWIQSSVSTVFRSISAAPKGQNAKLICNMKGKKINFIDWEFLLKKAINEAERFIECEM